jgi:hypothetical protein
MALRTRDTPASFFEELYAIVVGLGLALAVEQIIQPGRSGLPVRTEHAAVFLAYLILAFALAHSSVRYLQLGYDDGGLVLNRTRVVADLVLGVGQFLFLISLAFLITRPTAFAIGAILLLVGRPFRDLILGGLGYERLELDRKVATLHTVTVGILAIALAASQVVSPGSETLIMKIAVLIGSLVFGLGLYVWAFEFFFPGEEAGSPIS